MEPSGTLSDGERLRWPECRRKAYGTQIARRRGNGGWRVSPARVARSGWAQQLQCSGLPDVGRRPG
eukprot:13911500-Alexandrium_andersonii.AAC.1